MKLPLRTGVFWVHLACGMTAGLVILMMSVTGVVLTYQKQKNRPPKPCTFRNRLLTTLLKIEPNWTEKPTEAP